MPAAGLTPKDGKGEKPQVGGRVRPGASTAHRADRRPAAVDFEGGKYQGRRAREPTRTTRERSSLEAAGEKLHAYDDGPQGAGPAASSEAVQAGKLGVDLAVQMNDLRNQSQTEFTALRQVNGRNCLEVGGVWIDEAFTPKT